MSPIPLATKTSQDAPQADATPETGSSRGKSSEGKRAEWPAARTTPPPRARGAVRAAMGTNGHCGTFSGARTVESETSNGLADNSWIDYRRLKNASEPLSIK
ncbi:hypothetical protein CKAH01_08009 [Colletotrichum kahawae]|uniref:Uncharacterized protein n=1 Tax=Colletotrichum kahawae TaxID=34407 RepID=A0AAE0D283_COLKA|nr:hypothetical protein CKAH01_08009 [Colletotrichum kahawae]